MTMASYVLYVYCRRDGVSRDAGRHASGEYSDDEAAVEGLMGEARKLRRYYDTIGVSILCGTRLVHAGRVT